MMQAIEISHLRKTFRGKRGARIEALSDLSLSLAPGEIFGFLGPNGAGKSTTIKMLMGLLRPSGGSVRIFGVDALNCAARRRLGYLPENPSFYDYLNADEYLALVAGVFRMEKSALVERSQRVLERVDLVDARKRLIRTYSKGMVQRLGIAQALLHDPDLLIFDEPMSGLDPLGRALVKSLILELKREGKTVFFSTHITADVEEICDRYGILVRGRLLETGCVAESLAQTIQEYVLEVVEKGMKQRLLVPKTELLRYMSRFEAEGVRIEKVAPASHNLEQIFLQAVARDRESLA